MPVAGSPELVHLAVEAWQDEDRPWLSGEVATLTLRRPEKLNALNRALIEAATRALEGLAQQESVRVVVIRGAGGKAFCGGADLDELEQVSGEEGARTFIRALHGLMTAVRDCPMPVVAAVEGHCYGAGLELAARCDLAIADEAGRFGVPEVHLGIPTVIEGALLPLLVGHRRARDLVLTGRVLDAREALEWGLIDRIAGEGPFDSAVAKLVVELLQAGPKALRLQKELCLSWERLAIDAAIEAGVEAFGKAYRSSEPQDMIAAWRRPRRLAKENLSS